MCFLPEEWGCDLSWKTWVGCRWRQIRSLSPGRQRIKEDRLHRQLAQLMSSALSERREQCQWDYKDMNMMARMFNICSQICTGVIKMLVCDQRIQLKIPDKTSVYVFWAVIWEGNWSSPLLGPAWSEELWSQCEGQCWTAALDHRSQWSRRWSYLEAHQGRWLLPETDEQWMKGRWAHLSGIKQSFKALDYCRFF